MSTDNTVSLNGTATTWPEVLTLAEAAAYLRVSAETIAHQLELGLMPGRCLDGEWRLAFADLTAWLRGRSPSPAIISRYPIPAETDEEMEAYLMELKRLRDSWGMIGDDDVGES